MRMGGWVLAGMVLAGSSLALGARGGKDAKAPVAAAKEEGVVGCSDTKLFHRPGCKWVKEIEKAGTKVTFASGAEARKKGYKACGDCKP